VIRWREGTVRRVVAARPGAVEVSVATADGEVAALAYPALVGTPATGDRVLLNTAALELGLGTGGYALVVALPDRLPPDRPLPGHLVKARYTPLQAVVAGVDEPGTPHHQLLRDADDVAGLPVVVADLHSALAPVLAALRERRPAARAVYVMTDGGALPVWFSRTVDALRSLGWLAAVVSAGQAFGGDVEAVTVHTALLAARHVLGADVVVVTQGPGNLGTETRWGFSGVGSGEVVNAVAALGGRAVAALRVSQADPRRRHRGVSHHSLTAYGRVALAPADVVVPRLPGALGAEVRAAAEPLAARHRLVEVDLDGLDEVLRACPVPLSSMGRGLDDDRAYFLAAAAAGRHAATLLG
jgi:diadenosine tetraphosphatase ApaH/serine/threonine PP2A family protein phosphatase